uniref:Uncharacterized protein n=1 Tax=Rhizophora mucronata TaxID=61149 RepID=A0A2P2NUV8_RHIMU
MQWNSMRVIFTSGPRIPLFFWSSVKPLTEDKSWISHLELRARATLCLQFL